MAGTEAGRDVGAGAGLAATPGRAVQEDRAGAAGRPAAAHRTPERAELAAFLRAMRARLGPEDVGLPATDRRRTPGLRRQEVAQLAAVSIDWYIRLEQGRVGTPGAAVLDALATALRLSEAERRHLHVIARGEAPVTGHIPARVGTSLRMLLDGMPLLPAYVLDARLDIRAHNAAAEALFGTDFGTGDQDNLARMLFLDTPVAAMQLDWAKVARETVGNLRANLARQRDDDGLRAVIGELHAHSPQFAAWWADHTVRERGHGSKRLAHPTVGEITVRYDALAAPGESGLRLVAVTPADAAAEQALRTIVAERSAALARPGSRAIVA
ncbi:helix-turn-helix transcriptional regulator [Streptomyces sp. LN785]|uniref:helix-turn-helix transcriptional regulator n=1 Tax=Streptomyces sp. LN785 TaxID=3112983 RepID=UPI003715EB32